MDIKLQKEELKYPAPFLAHWVTGPVACCDKHCKDIVGLGNLMGATVAVSENKDESIQCTNCENEAGKK